MRTPAPGLPDEFRLHDVTSAQQFAEAVAQDEDGNFAVIWLDNARDGDDYGRFFKR